MYLYQVTFLSLIEYVSAFLPASSYTSHGMVRDQVGQTVTSKGSEVILLKGGVEIGCAPITSNRLDQSYELNLRIDQNRSGRAYYPGRGMAAGGLFSLGAL